MTKVLGLRIQVGCDRTATLTPVLLSVYDRENVTGVDVGTRCELNLLHDALSWRLDLVLHLHRFHHDHALASLHLGAFGDKHSHYLPRHWSDKLSRTAVGSRAIATRA